MTAKIAFAFPTHPLPGTALGMTPPQIHYSHNDFPSDQIMYLSVGIIGMDDDILYSLHIQIFFGDEEVTIAPGEEKDIARYQQINGKSGEVVSYISLSDKFTMKTVGTYRVMLTLVSKARAREEQWNKIHELETYFAVSTEWDA
ncbi:hypothetical protein KK116_04230 [Enterobacter dykesii]|uniref:hypothetical protein n=1 Tax=Enterobacter TaxID=547 RepID=UPI0006517D56|nr:MULTISPECIES: hypothetical protein [Enterobacter]MBT1713472.1 hypothetical protein [Enterobacter dykesii]